MSTFLIAACCCPDCLDDACEHCEDNTTPTHYTLIADGIDVQGSDVCYDVSGGIFPAASMHPTITGDPNETLCMWRPAACLWANLTESAPTSDNDGYTDSDDCSTAPLGSIEHPTWAVIKSANKWRVYCRHCNGVFCAYLFDAEVSVTDPVRCDEELEFTNAITAVSFGYDTGSGEHRAMLGVGGTVTIRPCCDDEDI